MDLKKALYRYDEAAQILSVSVDTVRRLVDTGCLTRVYVTSSHRGARITAQSIQTYVERLNKENGSLLHPD